MSVEQLKDQIGNSLSKLRGRPTVSFEFFPPKTAEMEETFTMHASNSGRSFFRSIIQLATCWVRK